MPQITLPLPPVQRFPRPAVGQSVAARDAATTTIRELAETQHGVVALRQLIELGLDRGLVEGRVERGRLLPLHRGVFALGHRRVGLKGEWMAAVLACGPAAVLSYGSAAHLWHVRGSRGPIEVTRLREDIRIQNGIPVTSLERTLLDMAARLDDRQLEHDLVAAEKSGQLRWNELGRVLEEGRGRPGLRRLRRVARRSPRRFPLA